jgi:beta,beta-carotene 9',10'-dioxygenase
MASPPASTSPTRSTPSSARSATTGARLGFETLEDEREIGELPLSGELPLWLEGSLLRTGPAKFELGTRSLRHWFDGLAMLHRFTIEHGCVSYGNRFL